MRLTIKRFKLDLDTRLFWYCYHDKIRFIQCKMFTEFDDDCPYWYVLFELSFITICFTWTNYEPDPVTVGERGVW